MPTPVFICGAECGIAARGTLSAGTEHWSQVNGTPTVVTSGPTVMRSARCFLLEGGDDLYHTLPAGGATLVQRSYVNFKVLNGSTGAPYFAWLRNAANSAGGGLRYESGVVRAFANNGAGTSSAANTGWVPSVDVWYLIDMRVVFGTTVTVEWSLNGVPQTGHSQSGGPGTTGETVGFSSAGTGDEFYIDDVIVSATSGDYPIGAGTVVGLYPNGDKTNASTNPANDGVGHFYSATTDFGKGSGGGTNLAAQQTESTSWQSLQNPLSTTTPTNFIADKTGAAGEHLVWTMEDLPADASSVNGVMIVATTHSASATGNNQAFRLVDSPTGFSGTEAWNLDLSESTITVPTYVQALSPVGDAWTVTRVNDALARWGNSSDVNPDAYLDGVCLEVDYVPLAGVIFGVLRARQGWQPG